MFNLMHVIFKILKPYHKIIYIKNWNFTFLNKNNKGLNKDTSYDKMYWIPVYEKSNSIVLVKNLKV